MNITGSNCWQTFNQTLSMKRLLLFPLVIFLAFSCKAPNSQNEAVAIIQVDPDKAIRINRLDIMSLDRIIRLQNPPDENLGIVDDLNFIPNGYLLATTNQGLIVFSDDGTFKKQVGHFGRGPGEYLSVAGATINERYIRVLDRSGQKIIRYDHDGRFINEFPMGMWGQSFVGINGKVIVYTGMMPSEQNMRLFLYDSNFNMVDAVMELDPERLFLNVMDRNFFFYNGNLRFLWVYSNNIYSLRVDRNTLRKEPVYQIDFGQRSIPEEFFQRQFSDIMEFEMALRGNPFAGRIAVYFEDDGHVWFGFKCFMRVKYMWAIYSKELKRTIIVDSVIDDVLFKGTEYNPADEWFTKFFHNNQIYLVMDAWQFIERMKKVQEALSPEQWAEFRKDNPEVAEIFETTTKNDAPLIFVFDVNLQNLKFH
ncbi:MAG TPA: hypothetical protein DCM62_10250 [Bacteroidales bacterium]|nr:hypothetical protein [Bacteroidales bacterium]